MNNTDDLLIKVRDYADNSHGLQTRKYSPDRYIVHPWRVMNACKGYTSDIHILCAALLHDVLEDTAVEPQQLHAFMLGLVSEKEATLILKLVTELTDVFTKKNYPKLNRRTRKNKELERLMQISPEAQTIKYADIADNASEIAADDPDFARVYLYECRLILRKLDKGEPGLRNRALEIVNMNLEKL